MTEPEEPYDPNPVAPYPVAPGGPGPAYPQYPAYPPYPGPGYPAYPGFAPREQRPGAAVAASVLGFVNAGLLLLAALLLFFGATLVSSLDGIDGESHRILAGELAVDGLINLVMAGLLIGGGAALCSRSTSGRILFTVASGVVVVDTVYWLVRADVAATGWGLLFGILAVVSLALAWTNRVTAWLERRTAASGYPPVTR